MFEIDNINSTKSKSPVRMFRLAWGMTRRLFLNRFRPGYVRKSLSQRQGNCQRCGVCCQLVWRCHYFKNTDAGPSCGIYGRYRPPNCRIFPINSRDLADRDLVSQSVPCGFWWHSPAEEKKESHKPEI
ncbi:MAG: hypothetical protein GY710_07565 [Desulfobacteraceae bacterium]|nr:hypothetical protein [Desulfobacteraceae bacterium]